MTRGGHKLEQKVHGELRRARGRESRSERIFPVSHAARDAVFPNY